MKHILFLLLFLPVLAYAQFPANPNKIRLGNQTTADGLVVRTAAAPSWTPSSINNAWLAFDTVAAVLYYYDAATWNTFSSGSGGNVTGVSLSNDTLYITTPDSTFSQLLRNFANSNLTFTGNRVHNLSTRTLTIADGGTYPTYQQSSATDGITIASSATDLIAQTPGLLQIENSDTITVTADRIRMNAADTRIQQIPNDNALNRLVALDSLTGQLKYIDKSSISSGGSVTGSGTTGTIPVWSSSSALGDSPLTVTGTDVTATGTGFFLPPVGTTAQRPGTPLAGMTRYNTSNEALEYYGAAAWEVPVKSASATGLGTATRIPFSDGNGRLTDNSNMIFNPSGSDYGQLVLTPGYFGLFALPLGIRNTSGNTSQRLFACFGTTTTPVFSITESNTTISNNLSYTGEYFFWGAGASAKGLRAGASGLMGIYNSSFESGIQFVTANNSGRIALGSNQVASNIPYAISAHWMTDGIAFPRGTTAQRPFVLAGTNPVRLNTDSLFLEISDGTNWRKVLRESSSLTWDNTNTRIGIGNATPARTLHVTGEARITDLTTDDPTRIVGADADGDLGAITVGTGLSLTAGTLSATGGAGTVTSVGITAPAAGITVSGSPITSSGSMTLALADDLAAIEGVSGTGMAARTASNTWTARTLTAGSGISITNGDGVSGNPTISRTYSLTQITISGGSTFFGTTPERPDNDTGGSVTVSTVGSDFGVSGSTLDYTGASGALLRVEGSVSFSVADDGDYYLSIFKEGTEIAATSTRVTCVAGNYYTIGLPATTTSGTTNDTFDVRIATVTGNSTTTMHRCGFIIERVY